MRQELCYLPSHLVLDLEYRNLLYRHREDDGVVNNNNKESLLLHHCYGATNALEGLKKLGILVCHVLSSLSFRFAPLITQPTTHSQSVAAP